MDRSSERVTETYAAALQHDIADVPDQFTRIGVVRRPTGWFHALVDENRPALGPPDALLEETKERQESLQARGVCDEEAHNAAWEQVGFADRYREHLGTDEAAREALSDLTERAADGESFALVCFEGENKRCHRRLLVERLRERTT